MIDIIQKILTDENGSTAIEYSIFFALLATAGIVSLLSMGNSLETIFAGFASDNSFSITQTDGGGLRG